MLFGYQESIVIFIVCVVLLLLVFTTFIVRIISKYQKRKYLHRKQIEEMQAAYANTLLQAQLEIQEQTFQIVAREIHDNINQKLTMAKLYLNTISYTSEETTKANVDGSLDLVSAAITDLADISRSMSTDLITNFGLVKVIQMEIEQLTRLNRYIVDIKVDGKEVYMDVAREVVLFRILQESLNNIVKHSNASKVTISLRYQEVEMEMSVADNGVGFDTHAVGASNGLTNMQKRAVHLGGTFNLSSSKNGTKIHVKIPIYA